MTKCGYIAILGRPNAGKSTLLNKLVGEKIAGVSRKPQTTRTKILGIVNRDESQMIFLDTPGLHRSRSTINQTFNEVAQDVSQDADLVLYMIDVTVAPQELDWSTLDQLKAKSKPLVIGLSKTDRVKKGVIQKRLQDLTQRLGTEIPVLPVSAKRFETLGPLLKWIDDHLPEGPLLFDPELYTDLPTKFIVSEFIQEQLFRQLGQEVPHKCAVRIRQFEERMNDTVIDAELLINQSSHKPILIGEKGSRIKEIGIKSRESIEQLLGRPCHLNLHVKVADGWIDNSRLIAELTQFATD